MGGVLIVLMLQTPICRSPKLQNVINKLIGKIIWQLTHNLLQRKNNHNSIQECLQLPLLRMRYINKFQISTTNGYAFKVLKPSQAEVVLLV